jgi:hypothetical protein
VSRPTVALTPAQKAEVETLAAVLNTEQIADYFGISRNTFAAIRERDPDVDERYKRGKARAIGAVAQSLIQKARAGNVACMIFYLKTQAGWRETNAVEHDVGDAIGDLLKSVAESGRRIGEPMDVPRIGVVRETSG